MAVVSKKRYLSLLFLVPAVALLSFSVTACGSSSQFLHQQYLVSFTHPLNADGDLDESDKTPGEKTSYYRIDNDSKDPSYIQTDANGSAISGESSKAIVGLMGIYNSIATYIYSVTTSLVKYAHQQLSFPSLMGLSFTENGQVTSLSGDFIFASSSTFAFGNSSKNLGFGIATLRFDIVPWSQNQLESASTTRWTQPLFSKQYTPDEDKKIPSGNPPVDGPSIHDQESELLKGKTFLKLFEIRNIAILYKFYKFGNKVPTSFYSDNSSCMSIMSTNDGKGTPDLTSKQNYVESVGSAFDALTNTNQKYRAISLEGSNGLWTDGFVVRMQNLLALISYSVIDKKPPEKTDPQPTNQIKNDNVDTPPESSLTIKPFNSVSVFPESYLNTWFDKHISLPSWFQRLVIDESKLDLKSFVDLNGVSTPPQEKTGQISEYAEIWKWFGTITSGFSQFLGKVSENHPPMPNEKISSLDSDYFTCNDNIIKMFQYFFNDPNQNMPTITPVTYSYCSYKSATPNVFPYYGQKVIDKSKVN